MRKIWGEAIVRVLLILALTRCLPQPARAACNIIPGTTQAFRGALGTADRPYARPGDFIELSLAPACDAASPGFAASAADNVVTFVFTPPRGAPNRNDVVILAADCAALEGQRASCAARPEIASATCISTNQTGQPVDVEVVTRERQRHLRVRFPDTDLLLAGADDDHTFAGPAAIAVSRPVDVLPCNLAAQDCRQQSGLVACIDDFFAVDGTCGGTLDPTFPHFTALPPPNSYQSLCFDPVPPCTGTATEVRLTTDTEGNLLIPMDWRGILLGQGVPVARLLRGGSSVEAFPGTGRPIRIPGNGFLGAYSPEGGLLPPVFDPQTDLSATAEATLFGSADAPDTMLRIARRSPTFTQCHDGTNDGLPCIEAADCPSGTCGATTCMTGASFGEACSSDDDCSGGECGPSLFEFRTRYLLDTGPILIERFGVAGVCQAGTNQGATCTFNVECPQSVCVGYRLIAQDPVPLEGLNQTQQLNAFVVSEPVNGRDLNADQDASDDVLLLANRRTGQTQAIGNGGASGQAAVRIHQAPFSFPAVASEEHLVAFLQSEGTTNDPAPPHHAVDLNGDGDTFDSILRVVRLGGDEVTASLATPRAVDAAPLVNSRSLAISNGLVFYRRPEWIGARQKTSEPLCVDSSGNLIEDGCDDTGSISRSLVSDDARFVAFGDFHSQLFVRDRSDATTELVSVDGTGNALPADAGYSNGHLSMSSDGRYAMFSSSAPSWLDPNYQAGVRLWDRATGKTQTLLWLANAGAPVLSSNAGAIAMLASDPLLPEDTNHAVDVYAADLLAGSLERVSVSSAGHQGNGPSGHRAMAISGDGRFVAFTSEATNLVRGSSTNQVFVHDRTTGLTECVSVDNSGNQGDASLGTVALNADGRYVAFSSDASNLVAGDTNGAGDIFVRDRLRDTTERVSIDSNGNQGSGGYVPSISADGRFVGFGGATEAFVHDRVTGMTDAVSVDNLNQQRGGYPIGITPYGRHVLFGSRSRFLSGLNANEPQFYLRGVDETAQASDATGDLVLDDTVLEVLDGSSGSVTALCPAAAVVVANGRAAFLRPESSGPAPSLEAPAPNVAGCPVGTPVSEGISLNGDGDATDDVVHLWSAASGVVNLHCAATSVVLSDTQVAALVSEAGQGLDLNDDGDQFDDVVMVHRLSDGDPGSCSGWVNTHQAADILEMSDSAVAFLTPEEAQGQHDLNDDGDSTDRILQIRDEDGGQLQIGTQAAEDFVLGSTLLAFRTRESVQGRTDLNGDGDVGDDVLQVIDLISQEQLNTHQAVVPCMLEACDPRLPYRVLKDTVKFLTFEADQSEDLNGNGTTADLVLQTFNVRMAEANGGVAPLVAGMSAPRRFARTHRIGTTVVAEAHTTLGAMSAGICTTTGQSCASDANCAGGSCYVPPGGCIRDLGTACDLTLNPCPSGQFCQLIVGAEAGGTCRQVVDNRFGAANCLSDSDCQASDTCNNGGQRFERLVAPLAEASANTVFTSSGRCVEAVMPATTCVNAGDCRSGELCGSTNTCQRELGLCKVTADCPSGATCAFGLLVATDRDLDEDEIPDKFDNCPRVPNTDQFDSNHNGVGEACDRCGDGTADPGEQCDDATLIDGDGCDSNCTYTACGNAIVTAGEECDDGNRWNGDGCSPSCQVESDVVTLPPKPMDVTISAGTSEVHTSIAIKVRNAGMVDREIMLGVDLGDCPPGAFGTPDFGDARPSILVPAGKSKKARIPLTIRSAAFDSFNAIAPTRCTARVVGQAVDAGGSVDPNPSNDAALVELNVIDRNDPEQTTRHEASVRSARPINGKIGKGKTAATKVLAVGITNADYQPFPESPGDTLTLVAREGCDGVTLSPPVCDKRLSSNTAVIEGGARVICKITATFDSALISTENKLSPQRCVLTLSAVGPSAPDLDPSNNSAQLTIDVLDKND